MRYTSATRMRLAWLGVFIVLFQAVLFGWHHHPFSFAARGPLTLAAPSPDHPLSPITADDDCDICAAIHHHGAASLDFVGLAPPPLVLSVDHLPMRTLCDLEPVRYFQGRAPPRA